MGRVTSGRIRGRLKGKGSREDKGGGFGRKVKKGGLGRG